MIACFLSNISAKYYKNPSMLSRVIAKNIGDVFFETQCTYHHHLVPAWDAQLLRVAWLIPATPTCLVLTQSHFTVDTLFLAGVL